MEQNKLLKLKEEMLITMDSLGYSTYTIKKYSYMISSYIDYLLSNHCEPVKTSVAEFIEARCIEKKKSLESDYGKNYGCALNKFITFIQDGYLIIGRVPGQCNDIHGGLSDHIKDFVKDILVERLNLRPVTIRDYQRNLKSFNDFIVTNDLDLNGQTILTYFTEMGDKFPDKMYKLYSTKIHLKLFFGYLYEKQITTENLADILPNIKYIRNKRLPSTFTSEEVKQIIDQIDRNSAYGKRAYAMILLSTRYGLRAIDVVNLRFENIDWKNSKLLIEQQKTKRMIELPLLPEVGNAILDYLKCARRESNLSFVFLNIKGPVTPITSTAFYDILKHYCKLANIEYLGKRHHGPHALRHALASKMLENGEPLTTISSVLGHSSTQVTTIYLSIDQENLKKCSLPIPPIHSRLYVKDGE